MLRKGLASRKVPNKHTWVCLRKNKTGFWQHKLFCGFLNLHLRNIKMYRKELNMRRFYCNSTCIQKTQTKLACVDCGGYGLGFKKQS